MDATGTDVTTRELLVYQAPKDLPVETKHEDRRIGQGAHIELLAVLFCQVHSFYPEFIKMLESGASGETVKAGLGCISIELEELWEELPGVEKFIKGVQVSCLGLRELGV